MKSKLYAPVVLFGALSLLTSLLFTSCTTDPVFEEIGVSVNAFDFPTLDPSQGHYELWFSYPEDIVSGKRNAVQHGDALFVSMGKFMIDSDGTMKGLDRGAASFTIPAGFNPGLLIDAIVTVESSADTDDDPSGRFLAGAFTGTEREGFASLKMSGSDAFGQAFDTVTANLKAVYRLRTPSSSATDDETQGIWFIDLNGKPSIGLKAQPINLENENWTYESWVTKEHGGSIEYISLGTFDRIDTLDANGAGPNGGPEPVLLRTPGEDFVQGTIRILNDGTYRVIISLQPINLGLNRPFYPLLESDIPLSFDPTQEEQMAVAHRLPTVEIKVDR